MLTKLVKYDLLFGAKRYGVLFLLMAGTWLSGLAVSLINISVLNGIFFTLNVVMTMFFVSAYIITSLQFFYNALSGDESYFNYTIPVKTVSLVFSKLAAIWIWGAAMAGVLVLTWVSLYHTLLSKMGMMVPVPDGIIGPLISIIIAQFVMLSCLFAFSISLFNTPKLKATNAGILVVAVAAYLLSQVVGILQIGVVALAQYISDADILQGIISESLTSAQEMAFLGNLQFVLIASAVLLIPLFFGLTVRTVEKRRSV